MREEALRLTKIWLVDELVLFRPAKWYSDLMMWVVPKPSLLASSSVHPSTYRTSSIIATSLTTLNSNLKAQGRSDPDPNPDPEQHHIIPRQYACLCRG